MNPLYQLGWLSRYSDWERVGTQKVGTQRVGTQRVGTQRVRTQRLGTQRVGTQRVRTQRVWEHRGCEHRGWEHRVWEHRGCEHRGWEHRGWEHRGCEHRGWEHRVGTQRVGTCVRIRHNRRKYLSVVSYMSVPGLLDGFWWIVLLLDCRVQQVYFNSGFNIVCIYINPVYK